MKPRLKPTAVPPVDHEPEGAHPAKQARSRELRDKALACARERVLQGRYASTSMADIAREVGCSVGALYFRFQDKDALFTSVVDVAMTQEIEAQQAQVAAGRYAGLSLRDTVDRCVRDYVAFVQRNDSVIRALYQRASSEPGYWGIVRTAAVKMVRVWTAAVAQAAGRPDDKAYLRQVGTAFWFVSGSLVHSVLVIGEPVRPLSTREQVFWLNEMVLHFIGLTVPPALQPAVGRRRKAADEASAARRSATSTTSRTRTRRPAKAAA